MAVVLLLAVMVGAGNPAPPALTGASGLPHRTQEQCCRTYPTSSTGFPLQLHRLHRVGNAIRRARPGGGGGDVLVSLALLAAVLWATPALVQYWLRLGVGAVLTHLVASVPWFAVRAICVHAPRRRSTCSFCCWASARFVRHFRLARCHGGDGLLFSFLQPKVREITARV